MAFTHITPADLSGKGVVGLPDTPQLSALAMQQKFDEIATDVIVPKFNDLADELDNGAGAIMNVTDPTSGTTDTLQNTLDHIETENALNTADRHNHANKATLDDIDATVKAAYDRLVTLLGAITGIQSVLSSSTAELPDAKAVADAIATVQTEVSLNTAARHTHVNKATLDDITALVKQGYDDLVTLLTGIAGIETTLTNSNDKIPRSDAVYTAVDNLSAIVAANTAARHTHTNKATLDAIDSTTKGAYDGLVTLLTGITTVVNTVTDNTAYIPTCHAIVDYVSSLGGGDMLKSVYDTNDDGVVDAADYATTAGYATSAGDSTKLGGLLSTAYALTGDLQKLYGDVATYQGTSSVALRNYAVGDFMIYNNYFYEVTQAISAGGTITDGTNISQTTIGAVLANLALTMTGATSLLAGTKGLVPAPAAGNQEKYLRGDGTWQTPTNTTTGDGIKTKVAQTGTAQSAITSTISADTTLDNAIGTLLNNDATLNAEVEWKYLGTESGTNEITLPANYKELYIVVGRSSSQYTDCASCLITKSVVNTSGNTTRSLPIGFGNSTGKSYVIASYFLITSAGKIRVNNISIIYSDGTVQDITSNAYIWVYYR